MNKMRLVVIVLLIGLISVVGSVVKANSNTNPYYDSVEELLLLMKMNETLERSFAQIRPIMIQQFQQIMDGELTPEQGEIMEKYLGKLLNVLEEEMSWDRLKGDFIQIYMSVYTEAEIQEMIKFYQSPVGQKTVEKTPILLEQSMEITQKYMLSTLPKIQAITEEMQAELEATISE